MNKFIITLAALALACFAVTSATQIRSEADVVSQSFLEPTNVEETAHLKGKQLLLTDFCLTTRDQIIGDLRRRSDELSKTINSFLNKSNDVTTGTKETSNTANGANQKQTNKSGFDAIGYTIWSSIWQACPQIKKYELELEKRFELTRMILGAKELVFAINLAALGWQCLNQENLDLFLVV